MVARTHGLDRAHIGAICDALTAAGIDPAVWSARAITDALDADMRARGWTWPDRITTPGAFLSSRLRRLSWTAPAAAPSKAGGCAADSINQTPPPPVLTDAARARITAAREQIRQILADRSRRTRDGVPNADDRPAHYPSSTGGAREELQRDVAGRPRDVDAVAFAGECRAVDEPAQHPLCPVTATADHNFQQS